MKKNVVILGGGVAGLSAGYFLAKTGRYHVTVLEQQPVCGGLCASFRHGDFLLDYGPHKLYSTDTELMNEMQQVMGDELLQVRKKNSILLRGHFLNYPIKMTDIFKVLGPKTFFTLGWGYAVSILKNIFSPRSEASYAEYMKRVFGEPAYRLIFESLADKVWGDPHHLHNDIARTRLPAKNAGEVIFKMLGLKKETQDTNAEFYFYPKGGFGQFSLALKSAIEKNQAKVITQAQVQRLVREDGRVTAVEGLVEGQSRIWPCDLLISTIPLKSLTELIFSCGVQKTPVADLQYRHLALVFIFVRRSRVLEDQWIFVPEREYIFSRISDAAEIDASLAPQGQRAICCDMTYQEGDTIGRMSDDDLARRCAEDLIKCGLIRPEEVGGVLVKRFEDFYPRYDLSYKNKMEKVFALFHQAPNVLLSGRIGMYNYNNVDHCFDMGRFLTRELIAGREVPQIQADLRSRVEGYRIVD